MKLLLSACEPVIAAIPAVVPAKAAGITVAPVTVPAAPAAEVHETATVKAVEEVTATTFWVVLILAEEGAAPPNKPPVTLSIITVSSFFRPCTVDAVTVQGFPTPMLLMLTRGVRPVAAGVTMLFSRSFLFMSCSEETKVIAFR